MLAADDQLYFFLQDAFVIRQPRTKPSISFSRKAIQISLYLLDRGKLAQRVDENWRAA